MKLSQKLTTNDIIKDHLLKAISLAESSIDISYFYDILDETMSEKNIKKENFSKHFKTTNKELIIENISKGETIFKIKYKKNFWTNLFGMCKEIKISHKLKHEIINFLNK